MFGTERRQKFITKVNNSGSIRKDTGNKPVYSVSVDKLWSYHPGSVPQLSGKITSARFWAAQFIVDYFSDLNYVHLMIRTNQ